MTKCSAKLWISILRRHNFTVEIPPQRKIKWSSDIANTKISHKIKCKSQAWIFQIIPIHSCPIVHTDYHQHFSNSSQFRARVLLTRYLLWIFLLLTRRSVFIQSFWVASGTRHWVNAEQNHNIDFEFAFASPPECCDKWMFVSFLYLAKSSNLWLTISLYLVEDPSSPCTLKWRLLASSWWFFIVWYFGAVVFCPVKFCRAVKRHGTDSSYKIARTKNATVSN